ncbi:MAG: hypothetical protein AAGD11_02840 [Planctomycetota bacterium]
MTACQWVTSVVRSRVVLLGLVLGNCLCLQLGEADTFTVAGFTFDDTLGPTNVVPVPPSNLGDFAGFAFSAQFIPVSLEGNDFDINNTVGIQLIGSEPGQNNGGTSVPLGDNFFQGAIELNWGGSPGVTNGDGDDFVAYENGSPNGPEAYMIAVRETGSESFTDFRYEFADDVVQVLPSAGTNIAQVLSTGFDLSDFGLAPGATIDAIIASNLVPADRVDDVSGQGTVILGGASGFQPLTGPQGNGGTYNSNGFDPDLTYIGVIVEPPLVGPGDFDSDGDVDGDDFLAWQRGESTNPFDADDLIEWQTNYSGAAVTSSLVPEPAGVLLLLFGVIALGSSDRRLAMER